MTGDEMKRRNVAAMGKTLGTQYTLLFQEVAALHLNWNEFFELFGTNDKRIERLNRAAPNFFQRLQEQQFETNMLHMARLTDPPKSVGKDNLTVLNLPNLVGAADPALMAQLTTLIDEAKTKTGFCRDWRNRRFAHHDLLLATQDARAVPLPSATKSNIDAALVAFTDVMNAIERHYYRGMCDFRSIAAHKGAATLLTVLGFGVKAQEKMRDLIARQKFDELDAPEQI
jgi:hypothetical protein